MANRMKKLKVEITGEGTALPVTVNTTPSPIDLGIKLAITAAICLLALKLLVDPWFLPALELFPPLRWVLPVVLILLGLRLGGTALLEVGTSTTTEIDVSEAACKKRTLFGTSSWREPLSNYRGIRWRQEHRIPDSDDTARSKARTFQIIDLAHTDSGKNVLLFFKEVSDETARLEWERLAKLTNLQAIDAREIGEVVRDAADLDKSFKQLADEGKLDASWQDQAPPGRLSLDYETDPDGDVVSGMTVTLPPRVPNKFWHALQAAFCVFLLLALVQRYIGGIVILGGLLVLLEFLRRLSARSPRILQVSRDSLSYEDPTHSRGAFTMALTAIESIETRRVNLGKTEGSEAVKKAMSKLLSHEVLEIGSDRAEHRIGGLAADELAWLASFLRSAVANA